MGTLFESLIKALYLKRDAAYERLSIELTAFRELMMAKRKSNNRAEFKNREIKVNPLNAKLTLFIFGIGPILLIAAFLTANGFFN